MIFNIIKIPSQFSLSNQIKKNKTKQNRSKKTTTKTELTSQIYDFHVFTTVYSPLHGFIWDQHIDQLPVGLLAQLVEHCTGIAEVMGSNSVQA